MVVVSEPSGPGLLIVSSHGDGTFQAFSLGPQNPWIAEFSIAGVGDTDGLAVTTRPLGAIRACGQAANQPAR